MDTLPIESRGIAPSEMLASGSETFLQNDTVGLQHEMHINGPKLNEKIYNQEVASPEVTKDAVTKARKWKAGVTFFRSGKKEKIVELPMSYRFIRKCKEMGLSSKPSRFA